MPQSTVAHLLFVFFITVCILSRFPSSLPWGNKGMSTNVTVKTTFWIKVSECWITFFKIYKQEIIFPTFVSTHGSARFEVMFYRTDPLVEHVTITVILKVHCSFWLFKNQTACILWISFLLLLTNTLVDSDASCIFFPFKLTYLLYNMTAVMHKTKLADGLIEMCLSLYKKQHCDYTE